MNPVDTRKEAELVIPMIANWELVAAETAAVVANLMGFPPTEIDEIRLSVVEACINAFEHSSSDDNKVYIKYIVDDSTASFSILITDHGRGFSPEAVRPPSIEESLREGRRRRGWGIELIRNFMDDVRFDSGEHGNTITLTKIMRRVVA